MASAVSRERKLFEQLLDLRTQVFAEAQKLSGKWKPYIHRPGFDYSAFNLACYLALRRRDLRDLQQALVPLGLSSLGRCEAHVLANLDAVIAALTMMCGADRETHPGPPSMKHFTEGWTIIEKNAAQLFGKPAKDRHVRVMVTLAADAMFNDGKIGARVQTEGSDSVKLEVFQRSLAGGNHRRCHVGARRLRDANKGPFIPETVAILDDVLMRMKAHHQKKMAAFRALHSWDHLWPVDLARKRPDKKLRKTHAR